MYDKKFERKSIVKYHDSDSLYYYLSRINSNKVTIIYELYFDN